MKKDLSAYSVTRGKNMNKILLRLFPHFTQEIIAATQELFDLLVDLADLGMNADGARRRSAGFVMSAWHVSIKTI